MGAPAPTWTDTDDVRAALEASPVEAGAAIRGAADALRWTVYKRSDTTARMLRAILAGGR